MAAPSWFFSTLAQSTAAALGFVIAFTAALYTYRRNRLQRRRESVIEDIEEFVGEYEDDFDRIYSILYEPQNPVYEDPRTIEGEFYSKEFGESISEWADTQRRELEALAIGNLYWAMRIMEDINGAARSERIFRLFDLLSYSMNNLQKCRPAFADPRKESDVAARAKDRYDSVATELYNLKETLEDDRLGHVIQKSKMLFIVGVGLPISFLLTVSESVPVIGQFQVGGMPLLVLEIGNLGLVIILSWMLFADLRELMKEELF